MTAATAGHPREAIAALLGGDDFGNLETASNPPVHWPALDGDEYADELRGALFTELPAQSIEFEAGDDSKDRG